MKLECLCCPDCPTEYVCYVVGLAEGAEVGVNWRYFFYNFGAWVFTVVFVGVFVAAMYSQGAYSPKELRP